jgi:hypothetical protein
MFSIFDLCTPRDEVLRGELQEDIFAARLKDVMDRQPLTRFTAMPRNSSKIPTPPPGCAAC